MEFYNNLLTVINSNHELMMLFRLFLAASFGGIVGLERGSGDRPAGFRTHILVCMGSALFMLVSIYGFDGIVSVSPESTDLGTRRDSARIAAQVVSGIGFLGAGTIMHEGLTVKGLTTAASLWIISAIGLAVGSGMYIISFGATVLTLITLMVFQNWDKKFAATTRVDRQYIKVDVINRPEAISDVSSYLTENGVNIKSLAVKKDKKNDRLQLDIYIKVNDKKQAQEVIRGLHNLDVVISSEDDL
ncbi:MAG: MgtC/SapB family protein [Phascolarctobacterium sp.]|nr:MgtC/SapB family protein [Phascolarctobacterium sp.]